ncbi:MAG: flagellar biosynthetic protein FliO [Deltaproteobacteria bacterium]|jgi:flagellar protein FliO/FliZ|nr:flagellar biosynthetic protein FliO [Deltaproteobacteria bacterium]
MLFVSPAFAAQPDQGQTANAAGEAPPATAPGASFLNPFDQKTNATSASAAGAFSWSGYFYAIGALCLILGALWGVLWLMRRSGRFRFMPAHNTFPRESLRIEAQIPLGPRRGLMVVRFLNKRLLLGLSDQHINLLSEAEYDEQSADFSKALEAAERQETDG